MLGVLAVSLSGCSGLIPHDQNDMAVNTLTQLFGLNLNQILSSKANFAGTNFVLPILFGSLNHVLLSVLLVLFSYVAIAGTIYSAQDGTFLGKKWGKLWIPIRAVMGALLVVPMKSGFCIAQYVMLSLIYIGIYMGSQVWISVTDKIDNQHAVPAATSQLEHQVKIALAELIFNDTMKPIIKNAANCSNGSGCTVDSKGVVHFSINTKSVVNDAWFKNFRVAIYKSSTADGGEKYLCGSDATCTAKFNAFLGPNTAWPHPFYTYASSDSLTYSQLLLPSKVDETDNYSMQLNWDLPPNSVAGQAVTALTAADGMSSMMGGSFYDISNAKQGAGKTLNDDLTAEIGLLTQQLLKPSYIFVPPKPVKKPAFLSCDDTLATGQGGWWCASNQYLKVDKELAANMQAYYKELQAFTENQVDKTGMQAKASVPKMKLHYYQGTIGKIADGPTWLKTPMNGMSQNLYLNVDANLPGYSGGDAWAGYYQQFIALRSSVTGNDLLMLNNLINALPAANANGDYAAHLTALFYLRQTLNPGEPILNFNNPADVTLANQIYNVLRFVDDTGTWGSGTQPADGNTTGLPFGSGGVTGVSFHLLLTNLFQGLLGSTTTGQSIGSIMDQLYSLGTNENCKNPISCHFSMIENAQVVGVDMIGGVVGAMESIYENFVNQFSAVISGAKANAQGSFGIEIAGSILPFLKGLSDYTNVTNTVAITVTLAGIAVNLMWLPLVLFVLTGLFVSGITFALLIPMTPYILFWAGKVAWLLLVIEALIAAPLMALGIAYPDGHDIFGIAEPGIKMAFNVVLMPVLLVIGLVAGIVLTYVVIYFSAVGFHVVASNILAMLPPDHSTTTAEVVKFVKPATSALSAIPTGTGGGTTGNVPNMQNMTQASIARGVMSVFLIFMYGTFIALAFNKCFSTIYVFPEKVLQWLGLQGGSKFGEQALGEMKNATSQSSKEGMQAGGQSLTQGTQAQQGEAKAESEGATQEKMGEAGGWGGLGQESQGIGQSLMS